MFNDSYFFEYNNHSDIIPLNEDNCEICEKDIPNISSENFNSYLAKAEISTEIISENLPEFYSIHDILEIMQNYLNKDLIFKGKLYSDNIIEETREYQLIRNRKRPRNYIIENNYSTEEKEKKRGRIPNLSVDKLKFEHSKFGPDNIIKKIKAKFFEYGIKFLNQVIGLNGLFKLKKLNYKYIDQLKKNINLQYLDMSLYELFSLDVSSKFLNFEKNYNKKILEEFKEKKNLSFNELQNKIIDFALNMTFRDFISLFIGKKKVEDLNIDKEIGNKIQSIIKELFDILLDTIKLKNNSDENYFKKFIFYMYNYERWFYIRTSRKSTISKN